MLTPWTTNTLTQCIMGYSNSDLRPRPSYFDVIGWADTSHTQAPIKVWSSSVLSSGRRSWHSFVNRPNTNTQTQTHNLHASSENIWKKLSKEALHVETHRQTQPQILPGCCQTVLKYTLMQMMKHRICPICFKKECHIKDYKTIHHCVIHNLPLQTCRTFISYVLSSITFIGHFAILCFTFLFFRCLVISRLSFFIYFPSSHFCVAKFYYHLTHDRPAENLKGGKETHFTFTTMFAL